MSKIDPPDRARRVEASLRNVRWFAGIRNPPPLMEMMERELAYQAALIALGQIKKKERDDED